MRKVMEKLLQSMQEITDSVKEMASEHAKTIAMLNEAIDRVRVLEGQLKELEAKS